MSVVVCGSITVLQAHGLLDLLPAEVVQLQDVQEDAEGPHGEHKDEEDGLLSWP